MSAILSLNAGSSSIKFSLFEMDPRGRIVPALKGRIERIGIDPVMSARSADGTSLQVPSWGGGAALGHEDLLTDLFEWVLEHPTASGRLAGIGHRVVHGGADYAAPTLIADEVIRKLEALCPLAPLHQRHNIAAIRAMAKIASKVPQVACFDTAFHHDKPAAATRLGLPRQFYDQGIRRYGFHGISYEFIARRLREIAPKLAAGRVVAAHLGNGASLCAIVNGRSIDTTMGLTPLDGLIMGTRCGSIDPGVILYLESRFGLSLAELEDLLYRKSGLLGISGVSSDMRELEANAAPEAAEAIELFIWRTVREIGALAASMGGINALVFTAGIGENDAAVRLRICERLSWLGIKIEHSANQQNATLISQPDSPVAVLVIPTDEEIMIAFHVADVLARSSVQSLQKQATAKI